MSAVRYILNKEHARLPRKPGDSTLYILGELSGHNIVLANLPGSQGKGVAAAVAKDMARTFPSIELRLIVGIGGGVPSEKNDIRLGDVVVSMPDGQCGGVVQYDLGKNTEDGFIMKEYLWPPPDILRSAGGHHTIRPLSFCWLYSRKVRPSNLVPTASCKFGRALQTGISSCPQSSDVWAM